MTKFKGDLYFRAEKGFCMGLFVQMQSSLFSETPIEDASVEWDTKFYKVAILKFFPQSYDQDQRSQVDTMCDKMAFNPWHAISEHRPLGNQNRACRRVYDSSRQIGRAARREVPLPVGRSNSLQNLKRRTRKD